jgi:DNA-binding LacI/PurR family transcriptional regulator
VVFGDSDWALVLDHPASVIAVDLERHAFEATELLFRHLGGDCEERTVTHCSRFVGRASIGPASH